jgi:hypothetical protein
VPSDGRFFTAAEREYSLLGLLIGVVYLVALGKLSN